MIAPVPTNADLENNESLDTPSMTKEVKRDEPQGVSELKTKLKRWKIAGVILMILTLLFVALSATYIVKTKDLMEAETRLGNMKAENDILKNTTACVENNSVNGTDDRDLQRCPYIRTAGKGSTVYSASYACFYALYSVYGCSTRCPVSYNNPLYSSRERKYYLTCYCGTAGTYDIYP